MDRLAALEAEVAAEAEVQRARKAAAVAKLRDARVTQAAQRDPLRTHQAELVTKIRTPDPESRRSRSPSSEADPLDGLGGALELASKANRVKQEMQHAPGKGEKSWVKSGAASFFLGPIGWLYAGSMREAVPAGAAWATFFALAIKFLPAFLLTPVLLAVMPLSAIAGVVYALSFNRKGSRQRLFTGDRDKPKKQLRGGDRG
jgi:hypothetical protein